MISLYVILFKNFFCKTKGWSIYLGKTSDVFTALEKTKSPQVQEIEKSIIKATNEHWQRYIDIMLQIRFLSRLVLKVTANEIIMGECLSIYSITIVWGFKGYETSLL